MYYSAITDCDKNLYYVKTEKPILNRREGQRVLCDMGYCVLMKSMTIRPITFWQYWSNRIFNS